MKLLTRTLFASIVAIGVAGIVHSTAGAADLSRFQAGRIIDDGIFTNKSAMSVNDIQNFLNSKVPNCDTNGTQPSEFGGGTRAQYGASHGNPAPFTCLKDYKQNPNTGGDNYGSSTVPAGAISAAQIIWNYSQQFNINPQVILVTLQKENGMVTDTWPFSKQYRESMGFGCPDNVAPGAPACNPSYGSFSAQIYQAARHFRNYMDRQYCDGTWCTPYTKGVRFIAYRPASSCGGTNVNIENLATSALYSYTPYQPNAASLAAGYGTGDGCSSYGNRNFFNYFTDWFGSTFANNFAAAFYAQSAHPSVFMGQSAPVYISYRNIGNWDWHDDTNLWPGLPPIHLAASEPINRSSIFGFGWPSGGRPNHTFTKVYNSDGTTLASDQHLVKPGQIARYEFNLTAPWTLAPGVYREHFQPILEGAAGWNIGGLAWLDVTVKATYKATFKSQCAYPTIGTNSNTQCFLSYANSGNVPWYDDTSVPNGVYPVHLAASNQMNRSSKFSAGWPSGGRPAQIFSKVYESDGATLATNQHVVQPGQIARFDFALTAPNDLTPKGYREYFQPVLEGAPNWNMEGVSWIDINVFDSAKKASFVSQSSYPVMSPGQQQEAYFKFKNTGTTNWHDDAAVPLGVSPIHIAATMPINRSSGFSFTWPSGGRPAQIFSKVYESDGATLATNQHVVQPGQISEFKFMITAPWGIKPGVYREYFQYVAEGPGNWSIASSLSWLDITIN